MAERMFPTAPASFGYADKPTRERMVWPLILLVAVSLWMAGCASRAPRQTAEQSEWEVRASAGVPPSEREFLQEGIASWYGGKFHGRTSASGEVYDKWDLTAAHRSLPLGTRLVVEHLGNGRTVKVKVNDRGPYVEGRIIDLSRAAAAQLNMLEQGLARVRLYRIRDGVGPGARGSYAVQVGPERTPEKAQRIMSDLLQDFDGVRIQVSREQTARVLVGSFASKSEAGEVASRLHERGLDPRIVEE